MARFLIIALVMWLAVGACSAPFMSCPLGADPHSSHDCCPRGKTPTESFSGCPYFVATKVAPVDAAPPQQIPVVSSAAITDYSAPLWHSPLADQHEIYLSLRVLRI